MLDAAEHILRKQGAAALTLRACARAAGVSHAAPAHHFRNLEGLLTSLAVLGFERMAVKQRRTFADAPPDSATRMRALGMAYVDFALEEPALFALMFNDPRVDRRDPRFLAAADDASGLLANALGVHGGDASRLDDIEAQARWLRAWSLVHGFCTLANAGLISYRAPQASGAEGLRAMARAVLRTAQAEGIDRPT